MCEGPFIMLSVKVHVSRLCLVRSCTFLTTSSPGQPCLRIQRKRKRCISLLMKTFNHPHHQCGTYYCLIHSMCFNCSISFSLSSLTLEDDLDDSDVQQLVLFTQISSLLTQPLHLRRIKSSEKTAAQAKMTVELAQSINDGLYFFEQVQKFSGVASYCY